jgi:hypothetical protein
MVVEMVRDFNHTLIAGCVLKIVVTIKSPVNFLFKRWWLCKFPTFGLELEEGRGLNV